MHGGSFRNNLDTILDGSFPVHFFILQDECRCIEITLNDFAIHNRKRYSFDKVDLLEHRLAIWIEMRQSKGSVPMELHELNVVSTLTFDQEINNEA